MNVITRKGWPSRKHGRMGRGGKRDRSGRKPGSGTGRRPKFSVSADPATVAWVKQQPDGYVEKLILEDKKRQELELEKPGPALAVSKLPIADSRTPDKAEEPAGPGGSDTTFPPEGL